MVFGDRNLLSLISIILLCNLRKAWASVDVCEYLPGMYCNCEEPSFRATSPHYKVSCVLVQNITEDDPVWRSFADSEKISYLKLQPILPIKLDYIPSDELRRMPNLKFLKVQEGSFGTLKSYSVSGYKSLEELELNGNDVEALQLKAIHDMPKLKTLTLSENHLYELLEDSLSGLLELETLLLDRNNISRIEACAFCNLQNLKELELWGNQISDLTEYTFRGLRYLRRLELSQNQIRILNDKVFHTLPRLAELDLRGNMISHIAPRTFNGLEKLQTLTLSNNLIKTLPNEVFSPLLSVQSLTLNYNQLEIIQFEVVKNIKLSRNENFLFTFKQNPFRCDCAMQWVATYVKESKSHWFVRELNDVQCKIENETAKITGYLNKTECASLNDKPLSSPSSITSLVTKSTDSVPVELYSQKSKSLVTSASSTDDETEGAYLSDVVNDRADVDDSNNACAKGSVEFVFIIFGAILTLNLSRNLFGV